MLKYVFINILFIIWLIIKVNMDECDIHDEPSLSDLLYANTLVLTWFCSGKLSIKNIQIE
jgi:hypothetical protein